jgi:hypothetical protein
MSNASEPPAPKPRLRWYQYRLRTLLVVMTLLAVWMAHISHRARQQKLAVEMVRRLGGLAEYDYEGPTFFYSSNISRRTRLTHVVFATPPLHGPIWLRNFLGNDYFQSVEAIDLNGSLATDNNLSVLVGIPNLKMLSLNGTKITDDGLAYIKNLNKLEFLYLCNTSISNRGLEHLKELTNLQILDISHTKVTDEGIKQLRAACPNLGIFCED